MNLMDVIDRESPPVPWAEGEKIPWSDPAFSQRMLQEHLSQEHDAASRRARSRISGADTPATVVYIRPGSNCQPPLIWPFAWARPTGPYRGIMERAA